MMGDIVVWYMVFYFLANPGVQFSPPVSDQASCQRLRALLDEGTRRYSHCVEVKVPVAILRTR
jgi:hypothetical protein